MARENSQITSILRKIRFAYWSNLSSNNPINEYFFFFLIGFDGKRVLIPSRRMLMVTVLLIRKNESVKTPLPTHYTFWLLHAPSLWLAKLKMWAVECICAEHGSHFGVCPRSSLSCGIQEGSSGLGVHHNHIFLHSGTCTLHPNKSWATAAPQLTSSPWLGWQALAHCSLLFHNLRKLSLLKNHYFLLPMGLVSFYTSAGLMKVDFKQLANFPPLPLLTCHFQNVKGRGTDKRKLGLHADTVHTFAWVENLPNHRLFCLEAWSIPGISRISFLLRNLMILLLSRSCHSICTIQNTDTVFFLYVCVPQSLLWERGNLKSEQNHHLQFACKSA